MRNEENNTPSASGSPDALLGRTDQMSIAALLAIGLAVIGASILWRQLEGKDVSDIDRVPPRIVEFQIDVNRAQWPEFSLLPGVGETLARRIIASRQAEGAFLTHEELARVRGIGTVKLKAIRPYLLPIGQQQESAP